MLLAGCREQGAGRRKRIIVRRVKKKTAEVALKAALVPPWGDEHSVRGKQYRLRFFPNRGAAARSAPRSLHPAPIPRLPTNVDSNPNTLVISLIPLLYH